MSDVSIYMTPPANVSVITESRTTALGEGVRQELKTAVHHELIRRMDLE